MVKKEAEAPSKFKSVTLQQEVYDGLDELRKKEQEELGIPELSWNSFFARMLKKLTEGK